MIQFGDQYSRDAYIAECERAKLSQTTKYAVAPRSPLGDLPPGAPFDVADIQRFARGTESNGVALRRLVESGQLLELTDSEMLRLENSPNARFIVARAFLTARGILPPGCEVHESDFTDPNRLLELVTAGYITDLGAPLEAA